MVSCGGSKTTDRTARAPCVTGLCPSHWPLLGVRILRTLAWWCSEENSLENTVPNRIPTLYQEKLQFTCLHV